MSAPEPFGARATSESSTTSCRLAGETLTDLAARLGRTPFYVYDRAALAARVQLLRQNLPPEIVLHYAIKANPMPAVVRFMAGLVDGLDVASAGELRVALDAGADPADISFAGPGKTEGELEEAVARRHPAEYRILPRDPVAGEHFGAQRPGRTRRGARESGLRVEVFRHEDGRRAEAVRN